MQGLVLCGKCGHHLTVSYHRRGGQLSPDYVCSVEAVAHAQPPCQRIPGGGLDETIGALMVQKVTPLALEVALEVQDELQGRLAEVDRLRQQQLQRAQYEAEKARLATRDHKWLARCRPVIERDRYGVARYYYAAPGCEFGVGTD